MKDINVEKIADVQFLVGSSTLILGPDELVSDFLTKSVFNPSLSRSMIWMCPEVIIQKCPKHLFFEDEIFKEWFAEPFLESPRKIFHQAMEKKNRLNGDFLLVSSVTDKLVKEFDNQNEHLIKNQENLTAEVDRLKALDAEYIDYPDEYPLYNEFGSINEISWLREYALFAETFAKKSKVDFF